MNLYHICSNSGHSYAVVVAAKTKEEALRMASSSKFLRAPTYQDGGWEALLMGDIALPIKKDEGEDEILSLGFRCTVVR
jgi:hypothetical protein